LNDKVSVIIPVYNSEKFLRQSIESVLNQSYDHVEVIAIDDGSDDNSLRVLSRFEGRITVLHQKNAGLARTLDRGVSLMTGRWFKWFSPDDVMYPNAIEELVARSSELGDNYIVYSNWDMIDENGRFLRSFSETNYNDLSNFDFNVRLLDGQQINVNTSLMPSGLFKKGWPASRTTDPVSIDYALFLEAGLIRRMNFHLIDTPLIKYRIHPQQLSHRHVFSSLLLLEQVRTDLLKNLSPSEQTRYRQALESFRAKKPVKKKLMESGLELLSKILPDTQVDRLLVYYLNNIRRSR